MLVWVPALKKMLSSLYIILSSAIFPLWFRLPTLSLGGPIGSIQTVRKEEKKKKTTEYSHHC